jgi:hypothetical protein
MYMNAVGEGANAALRARPIQPQIIVASESSPSASGNASAPANAAAPPTAADPDASPASAPPKKLKSQPSSPPPGTTDKPAEPAEPAKPADDLLKPAPETLKDNAPVPAPTPGPAPNLSPIVAVEESPKDPVLKPATDATEALAVGESHGSGSPGAAVADGSETSFSEDGSLKKKGEVGLDRV